MIEQFYVSPKNTEKFTRSAVGQQHAAGECLGGGQGQLLLVLLKYIYPKTDGKPWKGHEFQTSKVNHSAQEREKILKFLWSGD